MNWKLPTCISPYSSFRRRLRACGRDRDGGVSVDRGRGDRIIPANELENVRRIKMGDQNSPDSVVVVMAFVRWLLRW